MQERLENGLVVRVTGGEVRVRVGGLTIPCSLRGRLRARGETPQVVAGDRVKVRLDATGGASLEEMLPRASWLSRYVERGGGERIVVAHVERLFAVVSLVEPPLRTGFLDRVLASAEWGHIAPCIILNKVDLAKSRGMDVQLDAFLHCYQSAGYEILMTCAVSGQGLAAVEARIEDGVYAFAGESGVGKTSLVNRLDPTLDLRVQEIGERTGRGRHTTTNSQLFPFRGGYLADTPGMQTFSFPGEDVDGLAACFPEFARARDGCRFHPCTHSHEPGCGVKDAVERGEVPASRHRSYLDILDGVRSRAKDRW
jgi:ribosome biogenesis GTPase